MTTATPMTLNDMRQFDGTLFVRNNTRATVTCPSKSEHVVIPPRGSEGSVRVLPKDCLDVPGFQRAILRGKVTISPDLQEEAVAGAVAKEELREKQIADLESVIEPSSDRRDLIEKECLITKQPVFQTVADIRDMVPPLSHGNQHLAHEFVPQQTGVDEQGLPVVTFSRVVMG